jgi:hypothetical protein
VATPPTAGPRGLDREAIDWPIVQLPQLGGVAAWVVDGTRLPAAGLLAMRHPVGPGKLELEDSTGRRFSLSFDVAPEGTVLTEQRMRAAMTPAIRWGTLDPVEITPVVRKGLGSLKRCYERALRESDEVGGKVNLRLTITPSGRVRQSKLAGSNIPTSLQICVQRVTSAWVFPAPTGGPVRLDLPLNLRPQR